MQYAIVVLNNNAHSALHFAEAVLAAGHTVLRVFFFKDGVLNAVGEQADNWSALQQQGLELVCCITSAQKRGIASLPPAFSSGGLGLYAEAVSQCDKVIHFG